MTLGRTKAEAATAMVPGYQTRTDPEFQARRGPAKWEPRFSAKGFKRGIPLQTSHDCGAYHIWFLLVGRGQESDSARGITTPRLFFLILSSRSLGKESSGITQRGPSPCAGPLSSRVVGLGGVAKSSLPQRSNRPSSCESRQSSG